MIALEIEESWCGQYIFLGGGGGLNEKIAKETISCRNTFFIRNGRNNMVFRARQNKGCFCTRVSSGMENTGRYEVIKYDFCYFLNKFSYNL